MVSGFGVGRWAPFCWCDPSQRWVRQGYLGLKETVGQKDMGRKWECQDLPAWEPPWGFPTQGVGKRLCSLCYVLEVAKTVAATCEQLLTAGLCPVEKGGELTGHTQMPSIRAMGARLSKALRGPD